MPIDNQHIHTYGCLRQNSAGTYYLSCGFPVSPEAQELTDMLNRGEDLETTDVGKRCLERMRI